MELIGIASIILGGIVLAFGARLVVLGAAVGALFGLVILRLLPGAQGGILTILIPVVLAVLFAFAGGFIKGIARIFTLALGAVAGAAIVLGVMDLFSLNFGLLDWILALVGAVVGVILVGRFADWAIYILAGFVGALLIVRGIQVYVPSFTGPLATLVGLVLLGGSVAFEAGIVGGRKQQVK